jgi:ATP-binding cassette subfamily F protein uup
MEKDIKKEIIKPKETTQIKKRTKLSYKDQRDLERLPVTIEELEEKIAQINRCLYDPKCYEEKGLVTVADELNKLEKEYDEVSDRYLELLELQEELE